MLRLTVTAQSEDQVVVAVDGWLTGSAVDLVEREIDHWLRRRKRLVLDLDDARFLDQKGMALLRNRTGESVVLQGGSVFLRELLKAYGLRVDSDTTKGESRS